MCKKIYENNISLPWAICNFILQILLILVAICYSKYFSVIYHKDLGNGKLIKLIIMLMCIFVIMRIYQIYKQYISNKLASSIYTIYYSKIYTYEFGIKLKSSIYGNGILLDANDAILIKINGQPIPNPVCNSNIIIKELRKQKCIKLQIEGDILSLTFDKNVGKYYNIWYILFMYMKNIINKQQQYFYTL